jgi:Phage integrase, N-terminal SAM-like domain
VTAAGVRAFVLNYSIGGIERRYTIGKSPGWNTSDARARAKDLERWRREIKQKKTSGRSQREDESLIRQWIMPELGNRKVGDITPSHVDEMKDAAERRARKQQHLPSPYLSYDLRHSFASLAANAGASLPLIGALARPHADANDVPLRPPIRRAATRGDRPGRSDRDRSGQSAKRRDHPAAATQGLISGCQLFDRQNS